jgi:hypothetical protein
MKHLDHLSRQILSRRALLARASCGLGTAALAGLLAKDLSAGESGEHAGLAPLSHFAPRAKRVIYLFQSGGPSQMDLFDYKPRLDEWHRTDLPDSVRQGQRLTAMTAAQDRFPIARSIFRFARRGQSGAWISDLMPHLAEVADELCFVKSMTTEAINHDPAITFFQTGSQLAGRPSIGAWMSYGLGSECEDLPGYVAMVSLPGGKPGGQPLYDRLWGSGFLPSKYQGVKFRSQGDPVLFLSNPPGVDGGTRRRILDDLAALNREKLGDVGDPEIETRIAQYEMAFRMQTSVPGLTDVSNEPDDVLDLYGPHARTPGSYAANCVLARRLAERGVRFIQLFHRGWDQHLQLPEKLGVQCDDTDQATAALLSDLKRRGLLDETLVVWGGEFGRTVYCQGDLSPEDYGRDHHPRCFTVWMAGGGIRAGMTHGETDDFGYNVVRDPVDVHDLHATMLHCLGIDHTRLTFKYQGRNHRLTDVHGRVVQELLA